jgi:ketosteroid isomerase-like protein
MCLTHPKVDLEALAEAIDSKNIPALAGFITDDCKLVFGSQPPIIGKEAILDFMTAFFANIEGTKHKLIEYWMADGNKMMFVQAEATYFLGGGKEITLPFLDVFRLEGSLISEYLIYIDPTPLYAQ